MVNRLAWVDDLGGLYQCPTGEQLAELRRRNTNRGNNLNDMPTFNLNQQADTRGLSILVEHKNGESI